jgi:hypothetical protein
MGYVKVDRALDHFASHALAELRHLFADVPQKGVA